MGAAVNPIVTLAVLKSELGVVRRRGGIRWDFGHVGPIVWPFEPTRGFLIGDIAVKIDRQGQQRQRHGPLQLSARRDGVMKQLVVDRAIEVQFAQHLERPHRRPIVDGVGVTEQHKRLRGVSADLLRRRVEIVTQGVYPTRQG